jgi:hypothetical protein
MKPYIIITSYHNDFKHTQDTIFFETDAQNIDELVASAMKSINPIILFNVQEYDEYNTLNELLVNEYGYEMSDLRVVASVDNVNFFLA